MTDLLVLCEYATLNGGERSLLSVLEGIRAAGFSIAVAAPAAGDFAVELRRHGVEVVAFATHDDRGNRLSQSELRRELRELLQRRRPALVHANSLAMSRLVGPVVARLEMPGIGHLRDIVRLSAAAVQDLNGHRRLLAVSAATRDWHVAQGLDAAKTHVLHNGVDLTEFQPRRSTGFLHRELDLPDDAQLVVSIGQLGPRKGQDVLLAAAEQVVGRFPSSHFVIIGERTSQKEEARQFESRLLHSAAAEKLAGRVHFLGRRTDVDRILNEATLLVHAARQEPLGRVLLEAAACGLPIIATNVGGTREIFPTATAAARLIPPDDPAALTAAMGELLAVTSLRNQLAQAARRRAVEAFDARTSAAALVEHYRAVLH